MRGPPCRVPPSRSRRGWDRALPWIQQSDLEESSVRPGRRPRDEDGVVLTRRRQVDVRDRGESHLRRSTIFSTTGRVGPEDVLTPHTAVRSGAQRPQRQRGILSGEEDAGECLLDLGIMNLTNEDLFKEETQKMPNLPRTSSR